MIKLNTFTLKWIPMTKDAEIIDAIILTDAALEETEEFALGIREMRKRLPKIRRWYAINGNSSQEVDFPLWSDAPRVLVIINPALLISDNLLDELMAVIDSNAACALPADPRGFTPGVSLDYASRPGFDRFVARLASGPRHGNYDNRDPWIYLVEHKTLAELDAVYGSFSWSSVPALLKARTSIAHHAFIHSYGDYHSATRSEMLRLLPPDIGTLLDVGGGTGNFARTFMAERGGRAILLESNAWAATVARTQGIEVLEGNFQSVQMTEHYDCVAMLDVLEHLLDPLAALVKAHQVLRKQGVLLLSVPNVGHWSVVWDLLEGKFDYQPVGILCNTHLRFFTRQGLESLITDAGFRVERWENASSPPPESFTRFLNGSTSPDVKLDFESLSTESFHVLARRD
ncbi:MAG: class I SAM-dependent methyltransferase [Methylobacter sp.]